MRALLGLIRKEFIQVFRDSNMLRIIFLIPLVQLLLMGYVVNTEVKLIDLDVYDFDQSPQSREFVEAAGAGDYFLTQAATGSVLDQDRRFQLGKADMALVIPHDFSEKLERGESVSVGLIADGSNANQAGIGMGYAGRIAAQFSKRMTGFTPPVDVWPTVLYNPEAESVYYMVPGIVATLLTMVTMMLPSMAIARERETGTLEQLLVTPIPSWALLAGKVIPFAILGFVELVVALTFGVFWFEIPFVGSSMLLFALSALYLLTTLGLGLLISTVTSTQQQAMFMTWFFSIFAILTSGFFTPVANMPQWLQIVTYLNPMRFFMSIVRGIMMKGSGPLELLPDIATLAIYGAVIFSFSALRFSKRTA